MPGTLIFDFDGVLAESVSVKTNAFALLFAGEGESAVRRIVGYHERNGGISRFEKVRTIYRDILRRPLDEGTFRSLCDRFAELVTDEVARSPWVPGAREFLESNAGRRRFYVVSGTPQEEMREIVRRRSMDGYFKCVFGSPRPKDSLLREVLEREGERPEEAAFVGDAETDWSAARSLGIPFVWRKAAGSPPLVGFEGPVITDLTRLDEALAAARPPAGQGTTPPNTSLS